MDQKQWNRIEEILDQALSLESRNEQEQFIFEATAQNPKLRTELKKLLHAIHDAQQSGFMDD